MRRLGLVVALSMLGVACGGDGDAGSAGGSTTDEGSSTTDDTSPTTTGVSSTTDPTTSPATDPTTDPTTTSAESSTSVADSSSGSGSETGCTPGELDCVCDEGMCVDGLECTSEDVCATASECEDDEFGDILTEDTAHFLGTIDDDDGNGGTVMGILTGPDDVDWFRYDGEDSLLDTVDPFRTIASSADVRFCKFAECGGDLSDTEFACEEGASATTSPDGRPGCCADSVIHVPDANCSGVVSDDMAIWIRIDQAAEACVQYAFDYHY